LWQTLCGNNILPTSAASLPLRFQSFSPQRPCRYGLSK
jgi:hypothetical protein